MELSCYHSYYEINLGTLVENCRKIENFIAPAKLMPVIKADAYGMGTEKIARTLTEQCGVQVLACSQIYEGLVMRKAGLTAPDILVMGPVLKQGLPHAVHFDLQIPVFTPQGVYDLDREAACQGKRAKAQIKIETGLNRIGAWPGEELELLIQAIRRCPNIEITGVLTHFAQAEAPEDPFTVRQFKTYQEGVKQLQESGFELHYRHCCNTGAAEWFRQAVETSTHVRAGSLVLGYSDIADGSNPIGIRELLSWRGFIHHIRRVYPGETVSYDRFFKPEKPTDLALVGAGFADGLFLPMVRQGGPVLVNDKRTRFVDACMDQAYIDVTGIDCQVGDPVTFWRYSPSGNAFLSPQELSGYGQIYTAYTSACPERVKKVYI